MCNSQFDIFKPYIPSVFHEKRWEEKREKCRRMEEGKESHPIALGLTIETQSQSQSVFNLSSLTSSLQTGPHAESDKPVDVFIHLILPTVAINVLHVSVYPAEGN